MRRSTFLYSIGQRTADEERQLILSLVLRPGGVRPPLPKGHWPLSSNVPRGIGVGVLPVAALDTSERGLVGTVGARGMTTSETRLAGITRVNKHHRDVKPSSFVLDFAHQVAERPACHHAVEAFAPEAHRHTSGFKQPGNLRHAHDARWTALLYVLVG